MNLIAFNIRLKQSDVYSFPPCWQIQSVAKCHIDRTSSNIQRTGLQAMAYGPLIKSPYSTQFPCHLQAGFRLQNVPRRLGEWYNKAVVKTGLQGNWWRWVIFFARKFFNYLHIIQSSPPVNTPEDNDSDIQDTTSDIQDNASDALQSEDSFAAKLMRSGTSSRALHSIPSDYIGLTLTTKLYVHNFILFENPMLTAAQVVDMIAHVWRNTLHYASEEDLPESR